MQPNGEVSTTGAGRKELLGLPVDTGGLVLPDDLNLADRSRNAFLVTFVNPNACYIASRNELYVRQLWEFDRVCADGFGIVLAARIRLGARFLRQSFDTTSIAVPVLEWARDHEKAVILVGGQPGVASKAARVLSANVPNLQIAGAYPGFAPGSEEARDFILRNDGAVVICGMGAPLQEEFVLGLRDAGWNGIGFTCGGFFDQLGVSFHYYPGWISRMNLRFVYRLWKEPGRLGKRYLRDYGVFFKRLFAK